MRTTTIAAAILLSCTLCFVGGQRITTIQLDGVQYFVSRMNPYSPALNYFLAYQYCRSLGLQLASFETKEKADSITQYLINAGYNDYDFWTSGNRLGRDMFLWMSTGLPFNVTFNYMREIDDSEVPPTLIGSGPVGEPGEEEVHRPEDEHQYGEGKSRGRQLSAKPEGQCVALSAPDLKWDVDECTAVKDFICEQTRCYYYNYGSIPVSASQGANRRTTATTTPPPPPPPPTTTTTTPEPEEVPTTTTAKPFSSPSFKVNRRITLRPVHFPNLGSLLAAPWSSSLSPSPVYHHGKSSKAEKTVENAPSTVLDTSSSQPTTAEEVTSSPEVETTPMNEEDTLVPQGRKDAIDWGDLGFKTMEIHT